MKVVMGIDPGINVTGWALIIEISGTGRRLFYKDVLKNVVKRDKPIKLRAIHERLSKVIEVWSPNLIGLEEIFVNKNWSSSLTLAYARGICLSSISHKSYVNVHNNLLKKVFGRLWYSKKLLARYLSFTFNSDMSADDSTDALAIAYVANSLLKGADKP